MVFDRDVESWRTGQIGDMFGEEVDKYKIGEIGKEVIVRVMRRLFDKTASWSCGAAWMVALLGVKNV